jgi:hypothetical protein
LEEPRLGQGRQRPSGDGARSLSLCAPRLVLCRATGCRALESVDLQDCGRLETLDLSGCDALRALRLRSAATGSGAGGERAGQILASSAPPRGGRGSSRALGASGDRCAGFAKPGAPRLRLLAVNGCKGIDEAMLQTLVARCPRLIRLECYATAAVPDGVPPRRDKQRSKDAGHHRKENTGKGKGKARVSDGLKRLEKTLLDRSSKGRITRTGNRTGGDDGGGMVRTKAQWRASKEYSYR